MNLIIAITNKGAYIYKNPPLEMEYRFIVTGRGRVVRERTFPGK
jgi:hypothetical protein